MKVHFISGHPRSGSTLLAAILRQNPQFRAGMSSPLHSLFTGALNAMAGEGSTLVSNIQRRNVLEGLIASWTAHLPNDIVAFDTHRLWTSQLSALLNIIPDGKIICMVRSLNDIVESIERLLRDNPLLPPSLFAEHERLNIYSRVDALSLGNRLIGAPWNSLKEAYYGPHADALLLIEYDRLVNSPNQVLQSIYEFICEPIFEHDFENIEYNEPVFDRDMRMPGLHKVGKCLRTRIQGATIPPDLRFRLSSQTFWSDGSESHANVVHRPP